MERSIHILTEDSDPVPADGFPVAILRPGMAHTLFFQDGTPAQELDHDDSAALLRIHRLLGGAETPTVQAPPDPAFQKAADAGEGSFRL